MNRQADEAGAATNRPQVVTADAMWRVLVGWGATVVLGVVPQLTSPNLAALGLAAALAGIVAVIIACSFGVVMQAEKLAHRLGDPYGSLVLTLSIVLIEVVLIAAVMQAPGDSSTIGRDAVMSVSMIILNLIVGIAVVLGGTRFGRLPIRRAGAARYAVMLAVLIAAGLVLPAVIGDRGQYSATMGATVATGTVVLYAVFLFRQTTVEAGYYREPEDSPALVAASHRGAATAATEAAGGGADGASMSIGVILRAHRREILLRTGLLIITALPIVLLSHSMATLVEASLQRLDAPVALAGVLISVIVFLPEGITSIRAGWRGEGQRVLNLCHGALVSTVALTIPSVVALGALTAQPVILGVAPVHVALLAVSLALCLVMLALRRIPALIGWVQLVVFAVFVVTVFIAR